MVKDDEFMCEFFGVILSRKEFKKHLLDIWRAHRDSRVSSMPVFTPVYFEEYTPSFETLYRDYFVKFEEMMTHLLMDNGLMLFTVCPEVNVEDDTLFAIFYGFGIFEKLETDFVIPAQIKKLWIDTLERIKNVLPFITDAPRHQKIKAKDGKLMVWRPTTENPENYEHFI